MTNVSNKLVCPPPTHTHTLLRAATGPEETPAVRDHLRHIPRDFSVRDSLCAVAAAIDIREATRGTLPLHQVMPRRDSARIDHCSHTCSAVFYTVVDCSTTAPTVLEIIYLNIEYNILVVP